MKILLLGKEGQLGWELQRTLAPLGDVVALDQPDLDLCDKNRIREQVRTIRPSVIVNAAAYTAVDQAEDEPDLAMAMNETAPGILAEEAKRIGAALIHYSTDYVFAGEHPPKKGYTENMEAKPCNVYGKTKLAGEEAIQAVGASYLIFRTSGIYGLRGKNFLLTILRLARNCEVLKIVDDQVTVPNWSRMIAEVTAQALVKCQDPSGLKALSGLYHLSSRGQTSWYGFAQAILGQYTPPQSLMKSLCPIQTKDYPTGATRPKCALLDSTKFQHTFGLSLPNWEESLALAMNEFPSEFLAKG